jgi:hypothetical protein
MSRKPPGIAVPARGRRGDVVDVITIAVMTPVAVAIVFGLPILVVFISVPTDPFGSNVLGAIAVAFIWPGVFGIAVATLMVFGVRVEPRGLRFRRIWGSPKFLPWERIRGIRRVSRWEVLLNASLCPWRAMNNCMSTLHTYRIDFDRGRYYFPPGDMALFAYAVRKFRPDLLPADVEPADAAALLPPGEETGNPYQSPLSDLMQPR